MRFRLPLFLLAALAAALVPPAEARATLDHPGHNPALKCSWQADIAPTFVAGQPNVVDVGTSMRTSFLGELVGTRSWRIFVFPGYHVGFVSAWDKGIPKKSLVVKAYSRVSTYNVSRQGDCCRPGRRAKCTLFATFRVRAAVTNPPGKASASGFTQIQARNTGAVLAAAAAVTTDEDDDGLTMTVETPVPGGGKVKVSFPMKFGSEEESVDSVSTLVYGPSLPAPDEEYAITTDLDLMADADGAPWNQSAAEASLDKHKLSITTDVQCGHCSASGVFGIVIDATSSGSPE